MTGPTKVKYTAIYRPLPWAIPFWRDTSPVVLASGSAGGGKSRASAEKVYGFAKRYPGATCLIVRKTLTSMVNSTLLSFEYSVIGDELGKTVRHIESKNRFELANGSIIAYGGMAGMQERESIRSIGLAGGLDMVWMEEATQFDESDYNELLARMRGTAGPWRQIILSTNPDAPTHWINQRLILGKEAAVYYSGAQDNPYNPPDYISRLRTLTGLSYQRLVEGRWTQAEGVIYDNFDPERNIGEDAEYNPDWPVIWGVDDGYAAGDGIGSASYHPRVVLFAQVTPQGGLNIFDEYVRAQELPEVTIANCLQRPYEQPRWVYVDSSAAELKSRLWGGGLRTVGATHIVSEGIKNVRRMLGDGAGVTLLRVHPRCKETAREFTTYAYDTKSSVATLGEPKPLKVNDHCMDALRYLAWHLRYSQQEG